LANVQECREALQQLAARLGANAAEGDGKLDFDRTLACRIRDLDVAFHGRLAGGRIVDLADGDDPEAKIRLTTSSDDLVAMVDGRLNIASGWASGRVKIDASMMDLLRLRRLMS
jgi:putative sterol carrier protein